MATYRNLKELGDNTLTTYDVVILEGIKYAVADTCLYTEDVICNSKIFTELGLNAYNFCAEHYGYECPTGAWPNSHYQDYKALTRVVKALFEIIESENKSKEFNPKPGELVYLKPLKELEDIGICVSEELESFCGSNLEVHKVGVVSIALYIPDKSNRYNTYFVNF